MSRRITRPRLDICQFCDFLLPRQTINRQPLRAPHYVSNGRILANSSRQFSQKQRSSNGQAKATTRLSTASPSSKHNRVQGRAVSQAELDQGLQEVKVACNALITMEKAPSERDIIQTLRKCDSLAKSLVYEPPIPSSGGKIGAATALLSLDDSSAKKIPVHKLPAALQRMIDELSNLAYSVVRHPTVFIAPEALELYVSTQASLGKPESLPAVFKLYANKPLPQEGTSPIKYSKQNPNKVANAIPLAIAGQALQIAVDAKQLVVAMDIIEASYTTKAAHRAKFVRKGLLPATGMAVAPVAAYSIASQLAMLQSTMDSQMATNVAFAGILAYVGFTATIGVVAVTTANDQMDRVTWAQGVPLRERWIREEERAAIDKIAGAWGFKESWRRGEEEGEEWDALREWVGQKAMMLDRVELMEGME